MLSTHTVNELAGKAIRSVDLWIEKGLPPTYAVIVASNLLECDEEKLRDLWFETKLKEVRDAQVD